jgi:hypothetical protein
MQLDASREANALQERMFNQTRSDMEPWRATGANTLATLAGRLPALTGRFSQQDFANAPGRFTMADFQADPGYQFRLAEGEKAINRAGAARGLWDSGGTLKALTRYGQGLASDEFGNAYNRYNQDFSNAYNRYNQDTTNEFNRLASLAGVGQTAAQQVGQAGQNFATQSGANTIAGARGAGDAMTQAANARASGYIGGANAITGGVGQGINLYNQSRLLDLLANRGVPTTDSGMWGIG